MTNEIIATGGFNTGRLYSREGQRIYWAQRADGWLYFNDIDRMIDGWLPRDMHGAAADTISAAELAKPVSPRWLMGQYDRYKYGYSPAERDGPNPSVPADFDFGAALRI